MFTEMFAQLSEPRKKKRINCAEESPFPVPIASITKKPAANQRWFYYNAVLKDGSVYVTQEGDIHFLYKMGFFGKGIFSRGKPQHAKFISSFQGLKRKNLPPKERRFQQQRFQTVRKQRYERHLTWYKHLVKRNQMETNNANQTAGDDDDETLAKDEGDDVADEEMRKNDEEQQHKGLIQEDSSPLSSSSSSSSSDDDDDDDEGIKEDAKTRLSNSLPDSHHIPTTIQEDTVVDQDVDSFKCKTNSLDKTPEEITRNEIDKGETLKGVCPSVQIDQSASCSLELTHSQTATSSSSCLQAKGQESSESFKLHPGNQESSHVTGKIKRKLKPNTNKEDPYQVYEYLQLSLEEAFFLSYGLGCLVVKNENKLMNLTDMWKEYCCRQPTFLRNYIAYHYYRSKGWVPKTGVKYGAEFILYKKGPPFYHASYSVIIRMVDERSLGSTNDANERWSRWAGLNRVTETVAKEVLFCYVIKPTMLTDQELMSPKCISRFTIHEVVMKRIVPSRERANPQLPPEIHEMHSN